MSWRKVSESSQSLLILHLQGGGKFGAGQKLRGQIWCINFAPNFSGWISTKCTKFFRTKFFRTKFFRTDFKLFFENFWMPKNKGQNFLRRLRRQVMWNVILLGVVWDKFSGNRPNFSSVKHWWSSSSSCSSCFRVYTCLDISWKKCTKYFHAFLAVKTHQIFPDSFQQIAPNFSGSKFVQCEICLAPNSPPPCR